MTAEGGSILSRDAGPRRRRRAVCAAVALAAGACAAPRENPREATRLYTTAEPPRAVPPVSVMPAARPGADSIFTLRVEIGLARGAAPASPPQVALVAPDGRVVGYDAASRQHLLQVRGADEDSSRSADDDDDNGPPGPPVDRRFPAPAVYDRRALDVLTRPSDTWTLVVSGSDPGRFPLGLHLLSHRNEGSVHDSGTMLSLGTGEARRFSLRIEGRSFALAPLP